MGCEGIMDIDLPTEVGPTEETVEALMEYLVGPLLPLKHNDAAKDTPSEAKQKSVAKQVHAAAVLYNYYHLNHHRGPEFLKFDQFCNLIIMLKPSILQHMNYMCQSNRSILHDVENSNVLSVTEKSIMDACTVSETLLEASDNISNLIKNWPITKVAVFLIDSKKENCFLQFNDGVWSAIEKDVYFDESGIGGKKRKISSIGKDDVEGEDGFQLLAFSAVKEVAGIKTGQFKVLESHVVYSLSRAKKATRFYILQSTQSISEDKLVPIQDVISSLQGPVVKKSSDSWVITPVVEYYYLLPYADVISKWFSRVSNSLPQKVETGSSQKPFEKGSGESKISSNNLQIKSKSELESAQFSNLSKENPREIRVIENRNSYEDSTKEKDMNGSCGVELNNLSSGANNKSIDKTLVCLQKEDFNTKMHTPLKVYRHEKRTTPRNAISVKEHSKGLKNISAINESKDEKLDGQKKSSIVSHHEDFNITVDAKKSELSEAALRVLLNKRQKLCNLQRGIESELTLCNKKIQAIMNGGIGDCMGLKLEAIIDFCNDICKQDDNAQLTLRKACQELDDICLSNNWLLPTYHTSDSDGGFVANVTVKGTTFECSGVSGTQPSIHEARNSAATHAITKLQQLGLNHTAALL